MVEPGAAAGRPTPLLRSDLPARVWSTEVPVLFGRCDAAGIVYTPQYFDVFIGVIECWYRAALGLDYYQLFRGRRLGLGYGHASCEFFAPSTMGDILEVAVTVGRVGRSSLTTRLHVMHGDRERARGRLVSVATSLETGKVVPLPDDVRAAVEAYRGGCS